MLPGDIRDMALKACGFGSEAEATKAGQCGLVHDVERALLDVRRITIHEAARIAKQHAQPKIGSLIEQLLPPEANNG